MIQRPTINYGNDRIGQQISTSPQYININNMNTQQENFISGRNHLPNNNIQPLQQPINQTIIRNGLPNTQIHQYPPKYYTPQVQHAQHVQESRQYPQTKFTGNVIGQRAIKDTYQQFYCTRNCWVMSFLVGLLILCLAFFTSIDIKDGNSAVNSSLSNANINNTSVQTKDTQSGVQTSLPQSNNGRTVEGTTAVTSPDNVQLSTADSNLSLVLPTQQSSSQQLSTTQYPILQSPTLSYPTNSQFTFQPISVTPISQPSVPYQTSLNPISYPNYPAISTQIPSQSALSTTLPGPVQTIAPIYYNPSMPVS